MLPRHVVCLVAVSLIALAAGYPVSGAQAKDETSAPPARAKNKAIDNPGSRYQPVEKKKPQPEGRLGKSKTESAAIGDKAAKRAATDREKLAKMISARLDKFLPAGKAKKGPDDRFVVGTSEVRFAESHADVRFESVQGQKEVAEQLADYVVSAPPQTLRQWHIFARVKNDEQAGSFLKDIRAQWDALEQAQAEQARLAESMSLAYRSASDLRKRMGGYARSMCRT